MNIKDLQPGSYKPVASTKLNIKNLPSGSVRPVQEISQRDDLQNQIKKRIEDPNVSQEQKVKLLKLSHELGYSDIGKKKSALQKVSEFIPNVVVGALKGVGSTLAGASALGEKILQAPLKAVGMKVPEKVAAEELGFQEYLQPKGVAQKIGFTGEQIGEFFIPGTAALKVGKVAEAAIKGGKVLKGTTKALAGAGAEAFLSGGQTALQQGEINKEVALNTALGAAVPVGIGLLKASVLGGKKIAPRLINSLIGANPEFNKAVKMGKKPGETAAKYGIIGNSLDEFAENTAQARKSVGEMIGNTYRLPENAVKVADYSDTLKVLDNEIAGVRLTASNDAYINKLTKAKEDLVKLYPDIANLTPERAHQLKQDIASLRGFDFSQTKNSQFNQMLNEMYAKTVGKVNKLIPEMVELNDDFGGLLAAEKAAQSKADRIIGKNIISLPGKIGLGGGGLAAIIGGNPTYLLAGLAGEALGKFFGHPAVKTRLAKFLSGATSAEKQAILRGLQLDKQRAILKAAREIGFDFSNEVKLDTSVKKLPEPAMRLPEKSPSTIKSKIAEKKVSKEIIEQPEKYVKKNFEKLKEDYYKAIAKEYDGADNIISADIAKGILPGMRSDLSAKYHPASKLISEKLFDDILISKKGKGDGDALFTAGGTGSGKSSVMKEVLGEKLKNASIVFDSNLATYESAVIKIEKSIKAGFKPKVYFTYRDPYVSFSEGVLPRIKKEGRIIDIDTHISKHEPTPRTMLRLKEKFGDKIELIVIDNKYQFTKHKVITDPGEVDKFLKVIYNNNVERQKLYELSKQAKLRGGISESEFLAITNSKEAGQVRLRTNSNKGRSGTNNQELKRGLPTSRDNTGTGRGTQDLPITPIRGRNQGVIPGIKQTNVKGVVEVSAVKAETVLKKKLPAKNKNGDCYDAAFKYVSNSNDPNLKIVHGMVDGQGAIKGIRYDHAWVEKDGMVIDPSNGKFDNPLKLPKEMYYAIGNIKESQLQRFGNKEILDNVERVGRTSGWATGLAEKEILKGKIVEKIVEPSDVERFNFRKKILQHIYDKYDYTPDLEVVGEEGAKLLNLVKRGTDEEHWNFRHKLLKPKDIPGWAIQKSQQSVDQDFTTLYKGVGESFGKNGNIPAGSWSTNEDTASNFLAVGGYGDFRAPGGEIIKIQVPRSKILLHYNAFPDLVDEKEVFVDALQIRGGKVVATSNKAEIIRSKIAEKKIFKNFPDLSTKILGKLEGRGTVSKQFISDLTNSRDVKRVERDIIRKALETEGDNVDVSAFANKVKAELLPLKIVGRKDVKIPTMLDEDGRKVWYIEDPNTGEMETFGSREEALRGSSGQTARALQPSSEYEHTVLPKNIRGSIKNYDNHIFESPIKTLAGDAHYRGKSKNYFGHTRVEDMADNKTRRVIEVQSDLYQKGNLEDSIVDAKGYKYNTYLPEYEKDINAGKTLSRGDKILRTKGIREFGSAKAKLQQYNNPTAHFRMVREEVKKAAVDGKTKLQFPTGETAMKIEGLGDSTNRWYTGSLEMNGREITNNISVKPQDLKVGKELFNLDHSRWIITDVLGEPGKFKAVPKENIMTKKFLETTKNPRYNLETGDIKQVGDADQYYLKRAVEEHDISGKVDTNNPIYEFYEKDIGHYLKSNYDAKLVVDDKGVSWWEVEIQDKFRRLPVEAFGVLPFGMAGLIPREKE